MEIRCPHCQVEVPADDINIGKGMAHCKPCNQVIDICHSGLESEDLALVEKPESSRVESYVTPDEMGFILPPLGFRGITLFFLLFTIVWNVSTWLGFIATLKSGDLGGTFFQVPFLGVGAITFCIFLYLLKAEVAILINRDEISLSRTILGKSFNKLCRYGDLEDVSMVECYRKNHVPVYGIGLKFKTGRQIKFGSTLKEAEKQWILSEVLRFWKG